MKNVLYKSQVLEYESGWGSRCDGFIYSSSKDGVWKGINNINNLGDRDCYYKANPPFLEEVDDETYHITIRDEIEKGYIWM